MAVLIECISVIVPLDTLEERYPGGVDGYWENRPNETYCSDSILTRVGFMTPGDCRVWVQHLEPFGLQFVENGSARDIAVVDQVHGLTTECDWLSFARERTYGFVVAWKSDQGWCRPVYPEGWTPAQSAGVRWVSPEEHAERYLNLVDQGGLHTYLDFETGREMYLGRAFPGEPDQ